ncbi:MAG TPA: hypothetical protein VKY31_04065 [Terriglobia bacterium]|nr:hypothetical protein [Terriglobia bacterium]
MMRQIHDRHASVARPPAYSGAMPINVPNWWRFENSQFQTHSDEVWLSGQTHVAGGRRLGRGRAANLDAEPSEDPNTTPGSGVRCRPTSE